MQYYESNAINTIMNITRYAKIFSIGSSRFDQDTMWSLIPPQRHI